MSRSTFHLHVEPARFEGSRVLLTWRVEPESDLFRLQTAFFDLPDLDLGAVPDRVWYAMLFAHLAKAADATGRLWVFHFPVPIEVGLLLPWAEYFQLNNVRVDRSCLVDAPIPAGPVSRESDTPIGVLLGGGKDSMLTLGLMGEVYGRDNVTPIVMGHNPHGSRKHRLRHEAQLVVPLREHTGKQTLYLESSVRRCFRTRLSSRQSGLVLYLATLLPYWLTGRLTTVLFSYEFTLLYVQKRNGSPVFAHPQARLESVQRLAQGLTRSHATPVNIGNLNACLSKHVAFRVLARRYPDHLRALFMCEALLDKRVKWCGNCWKCFEYVLMCLIEKIPCEIDVSRYMTEASYIASVFTAAESLAIHDATGNLRWSKAFGGHAVHYGTMCHSFFRLDLDHVKSIADDAAHARLAQMKSWFGNRAFPLFDSYLPTVLDRVGLTKTQELASVLAEYSEPCRNENESFLMSDAWVSLRTDLRSDVRPYRYRDVASRSRGRAMLGRLLEKGPGKLLSALRKGARAGPGAK